jgi:signal transduction histidine kinase/CheY-like chemotaxis protein
MARFFGARSPDEVVGSSCLELYQDPAQHGLLLAEVEKHGRVTNFEIQAGGRGDLERSLLFNVMREGDLLSAVAVDISELKRAAADREQLEHQLLHAQKLEAVGRLAGGVAHDFNNLLTAIIGFAGMLKEELGDDDPRCEGVLGILHSANRAANLTRSLLAYSRKQIMQARPVDLCEIIRTVDRLLRRIIGEDVELVLDLPAGGLPVVADPGHVEQVLVNLCTNSRDAMPGGGRLRIAGDELILGEEAVRSRELTRPGRYVRVRVEDSGRGMSPGVLAHVFEPFYTTKSSTSGTGLGLSIVYGIVRHHGGHVELESQPGRGTVVTLLFPWHEGAIADEAAAPMRAVPRGRETILLAEDELLVRSAVGSALRGAGYEVVEAGDGEEAVTQFTAHRERIALCLLDVVMPRRNGREAAEAIRALRPGVPILLASGYAADVLEERGHGGVGLEVIAKPFAPGELLRRVREKLDRGA